MPEDDPEVTEAEPEPATADEEDDEEAATSLSNSDVCTKYREAAKIANLALTGLVQQCEPGALVNELCKFGDQVITQKCETIFRGKVKGKPIDKGVAFPTCVSVNECVCHNSPLESDAQPPLAEGDVVKLDVGCYIDGYIANAAHTVVVGAQPTPEAPMTGPQADCFMAAYLASEVAIKLMRPGNKNAQVTRAIAKVAEAFGCAPISGVLSHQMKRFVIDGNKVILLREDVDQKVDDQTFLVNEVYALDIAMSSGEGKPRENESRTTVYKRAVDKSYRLKMRASRYLFNEANAKFPTLPFTLRAFEDERQARMGVVECIKHELMHPYPVLFEREGTTVVHFKATVLLLPSGTVRITGLPPFAEGTVKSEKEVDVETKAILSTSGGGKKKKKSNKKKKAGGEGAAEEEA